MGLGVGVGGRALTLDRKRSIHEVLRTYLVWVRVRVRVRVGARVGVRVRIGLGLGLGIGLRLWLGLEHVRLEGADLDQVVHVEEDLGCR